MFLRKINRKEKKIACRKNLERSEDEKQGIISRKQKILNCLK